MLAAKRAMEEPGSPNRGGPSQSLLLATSPAPCVQLEARQLGSREEHRAQAVAHPSLGKGDEGTEPGLSELGEKAYFLPLSPSSVDLMH